MAAFDESGADGQTCGERGRIVELVGLIGEVAVRDTPGRGFVGELRGPPAGSEFGDDPLGEA